MISANPVFFCNRQSQKQAGRGGRVVVEAGVGVMQADSTFRLSLVAAVRSTVSHQMLYMCADSYRKLI